MATRMLIDARHPEETRVAVLKGNRIEEFDFESAEHKQIKGNIYLAKVTRVEPSLQAAFVDFGGNRHGFLAFSEIHPDYYQIPAEDRAKLLAEEQAAAEEEAALRAEGEDEEDYASADGDDDGSGVEEIDTSEKDHVSTIEDGYVANGDDDHDDESDDGNASDEGAAGDEDGIFSREDADYGEDEGSEREKSGEGRGRRGRTRRQGRRSAPNRAKEIDDLRARRQALRRRYKIQDVIQRRQVLLVQVVKEERGNKGAALTTYLSLAGRYCVLMPNSSHGGGISRKISSGADRKRLKQIVSELNLPRTMGLIVRTAGLQRTKTEIKRDFDYLARLWDEIRERTLASSAPCLIHSDSDLIKRAIRDIYSREIEEVVVEGAEGYRAARDFMKLLMPSHVRRVKAYSDPVPLFQRYGAEDQLSAMYEPVVQLKSGGYIVINPTEALVSIDINSGRATKEHGIEATALNTNLEAAHEIARQLRLRDMAGLVVIDFIDMENSGNVRKVERAMKEALKNDRARIQIGRISSFGLMEMSRQRLRTGVLEASTRPCPHCDGTGLVRTASSAGLAALRLIEDEAAKGKGTIITLYASNEASIYLLNTKRAHLTEIEQRYGVTVQVLPEGENEGAKMRVTSSGPRPAELPRFEPIVDDASHDEDSIEEETDTEDGETYANDSQGSRDGEGDRGEGRSRRRRRRGGRNRNRDKDDTALKDSEEPGSASDAANDASAPSGEGEEEGENREPRRKRRRRGGRGRNRRKDDTGNAISVESAAESDGRDEDAASPADAPLSEDMGETTEAAAAEEKPKRQRKGRRKADVEAENASSAKKEGVPANVEVAAEAATEEPRPRRTRRRKSEAAEGSFAETAVQSPVEEAAETAKPKRSRRKKPVASEGETSDPAEVASELSAVAQIPQAANDANGSAAPQEEKAEPRRGWWQRTFGQ